MGVQEKEQDSSAAGMRWQFWIQHSPSFAQKKLTRVSSAEIVCPFLSTYLMKDVILRFNTDVKNHIKTHIWLTTCISHRNCILLFSTAESSFKDFCQQRHFCPSWSLTNVFFPSVLVIESAYNTSWHQMDCIIWDFFSLFPTYNHWKILLYIYQENTLHESHIGYTSSYSPAAWLSLRLVTMLFATIHFHTADTEWEPLLGLYYTPNICTHL